MIVAFRGADETGTKRLLVCVLHIDDRADVSTQFGARDYGLVQLDLERGGPNPGSIAVPVLGCSKL